MSVKWIQWGVFMVVGVVVLGGNVNAGHAERHERHQKMREPQNKHRDMHPRHHEKQKAFYQKRKEAIEAKKEMWIEKQHDRKLKDLDVWKEKRTEKCAGDQTCVDRSQKIYDERKTHIEKQYEKRSHAAEPATTKEHQTPEEVQTTPETSPSK